MKIPTPSTLEPLPAGTQPGKRVIQKKLLPLYFEQVRSGAKPFEIRLNDEHYHVGDTLLLKEFLPELENVPLLQEYVPGMKKTRERGFTGRSVLAIITSVVTITVENPLLTFLKPEVNVWVDGKQFWKPADVTQHGLAILGLKLLAEVEK